MEWFWDDVKAETNMRKHRVSFELAAHVFDDPRMLSRPDPYPNEERWQTVGRPSSGSPLALLVVHTWPDNEDVGRIISARRATPHEGKLMKKGNSEPLSPKLSAELAALETSTDEIDTSDIPEVQDWSRARRGLFYRPVKQLLSLRLDADVVDWFKRQGGGYQTRMNAALRAYVDAHR